MGDVDVDGVDQGQIAPAGLFCNSEEKKKAHFRSRHCQAGRSQDDNCGTTSHTYLSIPTTSTHKRRFEKRTDDNGSKNMNLHDMTSGSLHFNFYTFFFLS